MLFKTIFFLCLSETNADWSLNDQQKIDKKRRAIEEAAIRENEAQVNFRKSAVAIQSQKAFMNKTQKDSILKTKDLLDILEMKIKEVTSHYFSTLKDSMTFSPDQIDKSTNETKKYEFGKSYRDFANTLPASNQIQQQQLNNHFGLNYFNKIEFDSSESDTNNHSPPVNDQHNQHSAPKPGKPLDFDFDSDMSGKLD